MRYVVTYLFNGEKHLYKSICAQYIMKDNFTCIH